MRPMSPIEMEAAPLDIHIWICGEKYAECGYRYSPFRTFIFYWSHDLWNP
jgi:hypothetical protein